MSQEPSSQVSNYTYQSTQDNLVAKGGGSGVTRLGSITGGSGYTNGTYNGIALTGGTGSNAAATIVVSGGAVTSVVITTPGVGYAPGDTLSASNAIIGGGSGSGFSVPVLAVGGTPSLAFQLAQNVNVGAQYNRFTTVAAGAGCQLPPAVQGLTVTVVNAGANPLQVYSPGDTINGVAGATGVSIMVNGAVTFNCSTTGVWQTLDLGTGFVSSAQGSAIATFSSQSGVVARAGGGQANATPIVASQVQISTCTTLHDSVILPPAQVGMEITIVNNGAASCDVYPASGEQINSGGSNTPNTQAVTTPIIYFCFVAGNWITK